MTDLEMFRKSLELIFTSCTSSVSVEIDRVIILYELYNDAQEMFEVETTFTPKGEFVSQKFK